MVSLGKRDPSWWPRKETSISFNFFIVVNVGFGRPGVTVNESDGEFTMCVVKDRFTLQPITVRIISTSGEGSGASAGSATEGSGESCCVV